MSASGTVIFGIFAALAALSAVGTVASHTPIRAALSLLAHILSLAVLYLTLHAHLLGAVQLIVYAGAVVVLFVFVIMLIGPAQDPPAATLKGATARVLAGFFAAAMTLSIAAAVGGFQPAAPRIEGCPPGVSECAQFGGVKALASVLYKDMVVPFELASVLLLVAVLGAIAVARGRSIAEAQRLKRELSEREAADTAAREREQKLAAEVAAHGGH